VDARSEATSGECSANQVLQEKMLLFQSVLWIFDGGAKVTAAAHDGGGRVVLPASVLEGHLTPGTHSLEVSAFDVNENSVSIGYIVKDNAEDAKLGALTPVAISGIVIGGAAPQGREGGEQHSSY
jgi:hypothetical protein